MTFKEQTHMNAKQCGYLFSTFRSILYAVQLHFDIFSRFQFDHKETFFKDFEIKVLVQVRKCNCLKKFIFHKNFILTVWPRIFQRTKKYVSSFGILFQKAEKENKTFFSIYPLECTSIKIFFGHVYLKSLFLNYKQNVIEYNQLKCQISFKEVNFNALQG